MMKRLSSIDNPAQHQSKIIILSSHGLLRHSLQTTIAPNFTAVLSYSEIQQLGAVPELRNEDVLVLLDPAPGTPISDQLKHLHGLSTRWQVVLILKDLSDIDLGNAIRAGVSGCITHETPPHLIAQLLGVVAAGHIVWPRTTTMGASFSRRATDQEEHHHRRRPADLDRKLASLSKREGEVLSLAGRGLGNKRIAAAMSISDTTVRLHMRSIMRKLGVENRSQLVIHAIHADNPSK